MPWTLYVKVCLVIEYYVVTVLSLYVLSQAPFPDPKL